MFDFVRNNRKLINFIIALIFLPFAFWGMDSYVRNASSDNIVATVGGYKISQQELQKAMHDQQQQMRASLGRNFDPAKFDTPEMRRAVLDALVNQRLLATHAAKSRISMGDLQLGEFIQSIPAFQENGKFSRSRYDSFVNSQGISQVEFEARLRQDLTMQQLLGMAREATITSNLSGDLWLTALQEEREVNSVVFKPEQFISQVKITAEAIKTYYETNRKAFETPEQLRAEYLVLSQTSLAEQTMISDSEIKNWYQNHPEGYRQKEERRASHILVRAATDAPEAEIKAVRSKAEEILAQVKKNPNPTGFAKLAKQYSQDPGSAEKGGDLGYFGRGMMVKPFDDAIFSLKKENQVSDLVRSDFGFHVIMLTGIKPEKVKPLEQVRAEITAELKHQAAAKKYAEIAEAFTNIVYEQADSLKPAVEKFKMTVQQTPWIVKGGKAAGVFDNPKLLSALFSDDVIKNKRNTEAIEVAPNTLIAARLLDHKPSALLPLESVKADIEKRLVREEASKIAQKEGEDRLSKLGKGENVELAWGAAQTVSRMKPSGIAVEGLRTLFRADVAKLPTYAGVALSDGGYALYRINRIKPFTAITEQAALSNTMRQQYARFVAEEDFSAWLAALRLRYPVEINKAALENKSIQ